MTTVNDAVKATLNSGESCAAIITGHPYLTYQQLLGDLARNRVDDHAIVTLSPQGDTWTVNDITTRLLPLLHHVYDPAGHVIITDADTLTAATIDQLLRSVEAPAGCWNIWFLATPSWTPPATLRSRTRWTISAHTDIVVPAALADLAFNNHTSVHAAHLLAHHEQPDSPPAQHAALALADPLTYRIPCSDELLLRAAVRISANTDRTYQTLTPQQKRLTRALLADSCDIIATRLAWCAAVTSTKDTVNSFTTASRTFSTVRHNLGVNISPVTVLPPVFAGLSDAQWSHARGLCQTAAKTA